MMNINTEYVEALQKQQETFRKTTETPSGDGFARVFSKEINRTEVAPAQQAGRSAAIDPAMLVSPVASRNDAENSTLLENITGQASGILDAWDRYAGNLASGGSQKAAWTSLLGLDEQVQALRGSMKGLNDPALESVVNELEIMAATEKFRLSRGDYA